MEFVIYEIIILAFMFLSAFFSGSETLIISANKITLTTLAEKRKFGSKRALSILDNMEEALSMILIGNNIVNIAATAFIVYVGKKSFELKETEIFFVTFLQSIIFLLACEIIPKVLARANANTFLRLFSFPMVSCIFVLKPFINGSLYVSNKLKDLLDLERSNYSTQEAREEINVLFKMGEKAGIIDESHQLFIDEILTMHEISVGEIMTPTIELVSVEKKQSIKEVVKRIEKTRFSRIPVYEERVDNIIGYIFYRDLFKGKAKKIIDIMRPVVYVPVTKKIYDLYQQMMNDKNYIVFVVNEYGAVEGIVTREDIAEEVVGEIQTKDHIQEDLITKISSNKYLLTGTLNIEYFSRYFKIKIKKQGFETLAGFITYLLGYFPQEGEKIKYENIIFNIESSTEKSINKISAVINYKKMKK